MKKCLYLLAILALLLQPTLTFLPAASAQEGAAEAQAPTDVTLYVTPLATGTGNCSSWANACGLQTALGAAVSGDEIWVQAGTYTPTSTTDRTLSFQLKSGVAIFGGFAGTETSRQQRDWAGNVTILSGELGAAGNSDNSYHVVTGSGVDGTVVLDGFTITGGNANGAPPHDAGGGMANTNSSPTLSHLIFLANRASGAGGGMNNHNSNPALAGITFIRNTATDGGGLNNVSNSSPWLVDVAFYGNSAADGGGLFNRYSSNPTLVNVIFSGNKTTHDGAGMYSHVSTPILRGVTFCGNRASGDGGGIYNNSSNVILHNSIVWGNIPAQNQLFNQTSAPYVYYSMIAGGCLSGWTCEHVFADDPLFVHSPSPGVDGTWGTVDDDYGDLRLQLASPAIDAGDNAAVPAGVLTDLLGFQRFIDISTIADSGNGTPPIVDMGAYEAQFMMYLPVVGK